MTCMFLLEEQADNANSRESKGRPFMITTVVLLLLAVLLVGVIATPGFAALGLIVAPLIGVAVVWWIAAAAVTHGTPSDLVLQTKHRQFFGPGGPDDPFADEEADER